MVIDAHHLKYPRPILASAAFDGLVGRTKRIPNWWVTELPWIRRQSVYRECADRDGWRNVGGNGRDTAPESVLDLQQNSEASASMAKSHMPSLVMIANNIM